MIDVQPTIVVIDDDLAIRESLEALLQSVGMRAELYSSASEFLQVGRPVGPACLVLDMRLPGKSGFDLQRELAASGTGLPIIFITAHGDIPMSVRAMKNGAIEFITKPFRDEDLLAAIRVGLERDRNQRQRENELAVLRARFNTLSQREREVMALVVAGRLNKQIAGYLGLSEITVKVHRGSVMRKMRAASLTDLVLISRELDSTSEGTSRPPNSPIRR